MNHDVDDAVQKGVLNEEDLPWEVKWTLGRKKNWRIAALVGSVIENSSETIAMDTQTRESFLLLQQFLFDAVYTNQWRKVRSPRRKNGKKPVCIFYQPWGKLPTEYRAVWEKEGIHTAVCDYISGMSDRFAIHLYTELFVPKSWQESANNRMRSSALEERRNGQMLSEQFISELKMRNDIEDVVGSTSMLSGGAEFSGLMPIPFERPLFTVYPDSQSFYCFGCGRGGCRHLRAANGKSGLYRSGQVPGAAGGPCHAGGRL